ncbi:MAG: glycosyltransferase [Elusimicrobiota bacterium]
MQPRPIFHLDSEVGMRGGQRQLLYLAAALHARRRRGVVYTRARSALAAEAAQLGLEVRSLPFIGEWDVLSACRLKLDARRENAILHAHNAHTAAVAALAAAAGADLVVHRRVDFPVSQLSARLKYGRAGKLVSVSKAIAEILVRASIPKEKIVVVPDGLPIDAHECRWVGREKNPFSPATGECRTKYRQDLSREFGFPEDSPLIGNIAALVPHKDHETLLAAALIVLLKRPRARFLIAGRGPEETSIFNSIQRMGMLGKVILLGHRPDPLPLLQALDLYVQSSWGEGMGSVLIEAAACAVPIVATTAGGIPEVVENGVSGLLVAPRHPEALANAIIRLIDDRSLAGDLAAQGVRKVSRFGLSRMADTMETVYEHFT